MSLSKGKKNLVDKIVDIVIIINAISVIIFGIFRIGEKIILVNFWILFILAPVVLYINSYLSQRKVKDKSIVLLLAVKIALVLLPSVCFYLIVFSKNYNLKYTYWVGFISTCPLVFSSFYEGCKDKIQKRISREKKNNKLYLFGYLLITFTIVSFLVYIVINNYMRPSKEVVLDTIKTPNTVSVYKFSNNKNAPESPLKYQSETTATEIMKEVSTELQSISLKNLAGTEIFNYEKMKADQQLYYRIFFSYNENMFKEGSLEEGYLDEILITSDNNVVILDSKLKKAFILGEHHYTDIYPINLSKETIDKILLIIDRNN
jgi:cytochrome c biogenesis factor